MRQRVLVIEDDAAIRRGVADALALAGYEVLEAGDARRGMRDAAECDYDLLLLDLVLPGGDGLTILRQLRAVKPTAPVIILTARGAEDDRVKGLRLGADDYIIKPFGMKELLARVEAVLRRSPQRPAPVERVDLAGGWADLARREVCFHDGTRHELSEREADLLSYLAAHRGRAISRDELLAHVWRVDPRGAETRTIDMQVARLREKLRDDPTHPTVVQTVRGKGYMLSTEGTP